MKKVWIKFLVRLGFRKWRCLKSDATFALARCEWTGEEKNFIWWDRAPYVLPFDLPEWLDERPPGGFELIRRR